jgi:hypothetical protein
VLGTVAVDDSVLGNGNHRFDPGETAHLCVLLRNIGTGDAVNVSALLRSGDSRFAVSDSTASYGTIPAGCEGSGEPFTCAVDPSVPLETPIPLTLIMTADSLCDTFELGVVVGQMNQYDPIPDGPRQPALYWAYDDCDAQYAQRPAFDWYEISARGSSLRLANDQTDFVPLPFNWKMYGQTENYISICSNGWVCPGNSPVASPDNVALPGGPVPGMVCLNWDDLNPELGGTIYVLDDALHHRFVVEWDGVPLAADTTIKDKFQVFIYDQTVPTPTGDNLIVVQYLTADGFQSSTVGIQDMSMTTGIGCLYNGTYHRASAPIAANRAIKFTTASPTGVAEYRPAATAPSVRAWPNPFSGSTTIRLSGPSLLTPSSSLLVLDASGRLVRTLSASSAERGASSVTWDGRNQSGARVEPGVYFVKRGNSPGSGLKLVLTR